jgi:hypothetical protein
MSCPIVSRMRGWCLVVRSKIRRALSRLLPVKPERARRRALGRACFSRARPLLRLLTQPALSQHRSLLAPPQLAESLSPNTAAKEQTPALIACTRDMRLSDRAVPGCLSTRRRRRVAPLPGSSPTLTKCGKPMRVGWQCSELAPLNARRSPRAPLLLAGALAWLARAQRTGLVHATIGLLALFIKRVEYSFKLLSFSGIRIDFL